jgi:hypothetical protein
MVACLSLIVVCFINQATNERLLLSNEILIKRNHLLDSLFKASDREDDSLMNRCDSLDRLVGFVQMERIPGYTMVINKDSSLSFIPDSAILGYRKFPPFYIQRMNGTLDTITFSNKTTKPHKP